MRKNIVISIFLKVVFVLLSMGTLVVLTRILDKEQFGLYSFSFSIYSLVLIPFTVGIARFNVRYIAGAEADTLPEAACLQEFCTRLVLALSLLLLVLAVLAGLVVEMSLVMVCFLFAVPFAALSNVFTSIFRGAGKIFWGNFDGHFFKPLLFLVGVVLCWSLRGQLNALHIALIFLATSFVGFLIVEIYWRAKFISRRGGSRVLPAGIVKTMLLFTCIGSAELLNVHTENILVGLALGAVKVAEYKVAISVKTIALMPMQTLMLFIPYLFSRHHANGELGVLRRKVKFLARLNSIGCLFVFAALLVGGEILIATLFGEKYVPIYNIVLIFVSAVLIASMFGPSIELLIASGQERYVAMLVFCVISLALVANIILIEHVGLMGVALVSGASLIALSAIGFSRALKSIGLNTSIFS